jgi:acetylornithine deacetylase/succinyl-diaminopimelate desuccinylase-like protein
MSPPTRWTGLVVITILSLPTQAVDNGIDVGALLRQAGVARAVEAAKNVEPSTLQQQARLCEIPAPPLGEHARAMAVRTAFERLGLANVRVDALGNVLGDRPGAARRPRLILAAHLDTVFPAGTDVRVTREGSWLGGPGIGDNCRGLAVLLATARVLRETNVRTEGTITFVATVGEEGLGDLRGVKHLFSESLKGQVDRFVAIDGPGLYLANVAVGSRRYRVTFRGPGGHSFADFGLANPIYTMARAIEALSDLSLPGRPRTTLNVGLIGGGTSINAIPSEAWMEVDLRSSDAAALQKLDDRFRGIVDAVVEADNARHRTTGSVTATKSLVGSRPAGLTPAQSPIVQRAFAAARALRLDVPSAESSSDSNVPIGLGIPAITVGGGGRGERSHAPDEVFHTAQAWQGTQYAVLLAVALTEP